MAVDQRIQTTITAGRASRKSPADFDQGPIMLILLSCLAVAMCFTTMGMGLVNVARGSMAEKTPNAPTFEPGAPKPAAIADPKPKEGKDKEAAARLQQAQLEQAKLDLDRQQAELEKKKEADRLEREAQVAALAELQAKLEALNGERSTARDNSRQTNQRVIELRAQETQITARVATLKTRLAADAEEERRQLQLRTQLDQELKGIRQQIADADRHLQDLRKALEEKQAARPTTLLVNAGDAIWVECVRGAVTVFPKGERLTVTDLVSGSVSYSNTVANRRVQFLVRPDGIDSFQIARDSAEVHGAASIGYEPVDANWQLKFQQGGSRP